MGKLFRIGLILSLVAACAPIQKQKSLVGDANTERVAGVGDVIARVENTRDLKNVFGAADIWGRKTYEGYSEVRYAGLDDDGSIVVYRQDLNIETDEDVLTRSGLGVATTSTYGSASIVGNQVTGQSTSSTVFVQPRAATSFAIPTGAMAIRIPAGTSQLPFAGYTIEVLDAQPVSLRYRLSPRE